MERKITIQEEALYKEDYQIRMLKANNLNGILKMGGRGINENSYYDYDVSGKISVKAMFERSKITAKDIKMFLRNIKNVIREVEIFLLDINCILLNPEYIFYEDGKYFFCYYPLARQDLWEEFHKLTEYFVKQADYQDQECIRMVFLLHKKTMDENYSLDKLIAECMQNPEEEKNRVDEKDMDDIEDGCTVGDWITEQELGSAVMRESDHLWKPVKKLLNKRRKSKWGDWDGLHIEEEDLTKE
jgi:hypothetical protein